MWLSSLGLLRTKEAGLHSLSNFQNSCWLPLTLYILWQISEHGSRWCEKKATEVAVGVRAGSVD